MLRKITINNIVITLLFSGCFLLWGHPVMARSSARYSFKHYNINNGLSQNTVHTIHQDSMGFIWLGTKDGLNRFNGTSFKVFKFSPEGELRDNVFHHIVEDNDGKIWVATEGGIYIYDPRKEKFDKFDAVSRNNEPLDGWVSDFIRDQDGDMWISIEEKGVFHYSYSSGVLDYYPIKGLPGGLRLISLCAVSSNDLWVFPYGLPPIRINKNNRQVTAFDVADDPTLFSRVGEVRNVLSDGNHQLIIPTSQSGLISLNITKGTHRILLDKDEEGNPVFARTVRRMNDQTLWIGSESGVYIMDMLEGTVINLQHDPANPSSLSDNAIYSIFEDNNNGIWIGSYFGGVDYYSEELNYFELFYPIPGQNAMKGARIREFFDAGDGKVWIGTEDKGLHLFDTRNNLFLPLPGALDSLYSNIHAIYQDDDYFWISTYSKGLHRYHLKTRQLVPYIPDDFPLESLNQNTVFAMWKDRSNVMWFGTLAGVYTYDYKTGRSASHDEANVGAVHDIFEDQRGNVWVGTFTNGLFRLDSSRTEWSNYRNIRDDEGSIAYNTVTSIFEDSKGRVWITTQGGGFCLFNEEDETFTTFNSTNGLINDVVYQMQEDDQGFLWLSTNAGLVRFHPESMEFKNYNVENGLRTNQFNYKSSFKSPDGTLYFGSINGFVRFNPTLFKKPEVTAPVVFTELVINNIPVTPGDEESPLKESILFTEKIRLPHHQNSLRLSYAVLNYANRSDYQVWYMMEGFDKDWIFQESSSDIIYANLNPGKYRLMLKIQGGAPEIQQETMQSLAIHIRPPFWLSGWAYALYTLLFISIVFLGFQLLTLRNQQMHKEKMGAFEQEKERELYRSKIDFFTHVAHEIRTPLSLIKAPLDYVISQEKVSEEVKDNLQIMSKNTSRLLTLVNQLLDFQKTESDAYMLNLKSLNMSEMIRETFLQFTPLAKQKGVQFELELPDDEIYVQSDKEALMKILSNLINNAIRYCDNQVKVSAYKDKQHGEDFFHFITENDGEPIPHFYEQEIFKPFVHVAKSHKNALNNSGTGIGLALSRSLTELHNGKLELENKEGVICFHLAMPVGAVDLSQVESVTEKTEKKETQLFKKSNRTTLLIIDDDLDLLDFEEKVLSAHYEVLTATNGEEGLNVLRESTVNLIVCDIMMPFMDGYEFTRKVKSDFEFSHIPVILLTAKVNVEAKVQGFEVGADAYIDKPFSLEVLMAQIANLLKNREKLRETFIKHPYIGANTMAMTKSDEDFIQKLHDIVHENLDNSAYVVEELAEQFNMSRASFYRKIKGVLNLTPNEYIRVERLKKAAQLLKEKSYKVNEICYMVGFNSPSYFSKCFQQQFGVLPKDFE